MKKFQAQVALITVMIIATVLTVLLSVSFQSLVDTQVTELEEENQKALAAAEAAIEASIKENGPVTIGEGSSVNIEGFTGGANITSLADNVFTTSKIEKNNSYTFYLTDYDPDTKTLSSNASLNQNVSVCFQSLSPQPALEITLIKADSVKKYVVDAASPVRITSASSTSGSPCPGDASFTHSYTVPAADIGVNAKLMIVKALYNSSKFVFYRSSDFPLQGKSATSEVFSDTGVSKKLYLFQTYPQIPADFFDTSF